ncbi:hypothetical protein OG800_07915 [Streptomyces sp. NBC_00445]|uniref:hypothetical protein n=1 Tax=Streptomyces sp. NBC_00445 TaxID=2975745 RepID=UPI002E20D740
MTVDWERIGQPQFDRIVEALVHRMYDATATVEAVNGRGGDGGIDIKVTSGQRVRIFQLKYYPDGFPTASFKGRRTSILKSFERAMRHAPWEWILVVPCTLTPAERAYISGLPGGRAVRVRVMDRAELDDRLAVHADLEASFTRDQLFEAATVYGQEKALLMDGLADVSARVGALGRQVDGVDDHWTVDFSRERDVVVHTLRGKHPRAHEVSPIQITLTGREELPPELAQKVRGSLGFGRPEEVVLPRDVVETLTVTGPEWLSGTHQDVEVRWRPLDVTPRADRDAEVVFLDGQQVLAAYPAVLSHLGRGSSGCSVDVELPGGSLQLMVPDDRGALASLRFTFFLNQVEPTAALRLLKVHQRIAAGGCFEVRTGGRAVGGGDLPPKPDAVLHQAEQLRLYVEDLDVVQRHCEQYFPVPAEVEPSSRIALRVARLLIDGHCAVSPFLPRISCTLNGQDSPALRALLAGGPRPVRGVCQEFALAVDERRLDLGSVVLFHPRVIAENSVQILEALDAGQADGMRLIVRPAGGEHFRLLRLSAVTDAEPTPVPLLLPGFPEPR